MLSKKSLKKNLEIAMFVQSQDLMKKVVSIAKNLNSKNFLRDIMLLIDDYYNKENCLILNLI